MSYKLSELKLNLQLTPAFELVKQRGTKEMKRLRRLNIAGGLAALLLAGSVLWLGGSKRQLFAAPQAGEPARYFKIGVGYTDVMPRQIVRTHDDRVYIFAGQTQGSNNILVYWTATPGVPTSAEDFSGSTQLDPPLPRNPISVDAVYDGNTIIHVLINENCASPYSVCTPNSGELYDHPFDITTNTFRPAKLISIGNSIVVGPYLGSGGVSGLFDTNGVLHVAYWGGYNHIDYAAFTYDVESDTLTHVDSLVHVDTRGSANHPILAVSPVDNSVTIAWISEASSPAQILARTKTANGWGPVELVGPSDPNAGVWTSTNQGISVDQGPTLIITADGTKHLVYIQDVDSSGDYGHVRYATYTSSTGWIDQPVPYYTHDPALATNGQGNIYILGHGHFPNVGSDPACTHDYNICSIKKTATGWDLPQLFATPPSTETFDDSISVRWSVVGWNRPDLIEFAFFSGQNSNYLDASVYYGTFGSTGSTLTPTPTLTPIATPVPTNTPTTTSLPAATVTPTSLPTNTLTPTATRTSTSTATATSVPSATSTPTTATGLVLALGMNEGRGTTVSDTSGQNNTGTLLNATWTTGRYGTGLAFNGSNSWVTVNDSASLNLVNGLTLEAWVRPTLNTDWRTIMLKEWDAVYELYASTTTGPGTGVNIGGYQEVFSSTPLPTNTWSHVAATWDGATLRLYVNGVLVASRAATGTPATSTNPLRIGGNAHWGEYFAGTIDEVRIYKRALSAAEIQTDMNTPVGP